MTPPGAEDLGENLWVSFMLGFMASRNDFNAERCSVLRAPIEIEINFNLGEEAREALQAEFLKLLPMILEAPPPKGSPRSTKS